MTEFSREDKLRSAVFTGVDLRDARFVESDLSRVVMRGVEIAGADIDAPWLVHGGTLLVNGVNVIDYVESELNKRFPGRDLRRPTDPDSLRTAWAALEQAWTTALDRVGADAGRDCRHLGRRRVVLRLHTPTSGLRHRPMAG